MVELRYMNQKGFIPIIFIIIGAVVLASATFGVVKYKDEITANISKVFKPKTADDEIVKESEPTDTTSETIEELKKRIEGLEQQQQGTKIIYKEVPPPVSQKPTSELSNSEIIERVKSAVVYIETSKRLGSGMIIEADGYILTNAHVVGAASFVTIKLRDGRSFPGTVIGKDYTIDVALLKVQENNLPIVMLGDSSETALKQGDEVFAFGYPFGLEGDVSFKEGTISRRHVYDKISYLETSTEIHPGNSGGPLVNRSAEVIGINTQIFGYIYGDVLLGESIKFALPINLVRGLIPELKAGKGITKSEITTPAPTPQPSPYISGNRARGFITISNHCNISDTKLIASTKFMETSNKLIFRLKNTIIVHGAESKTTYFIPSEITNVEIVADESGSEYLLNCSKTKPCRFTIPEFAKSAEYICISGIAFLPFTY